MSDWRTGMKIVAIGLSGAVGGIFAALSDVIQKGDASAIKTIADKIQATLQISHFPPWYAVVLVVGLAVALCFIFEPETKRKAFYVGASILSVLMLLVPFKPPPGIETVSRGARSTQPTAEAGWWHEPFRPAAVFAQNTNETYLTARVSLYLWTEDDTSFSGATITLLESGSFRIIARSRITSKDIIFEAPTGSYIIKVEAAGFHIAEKEVTLRPGRTAYVSFALTPARVPLSLQRLLGLQEIVLPVESAQEVCDSRLNPIPGHTGYNWRGNRCEGFCFLPVAAPGLEVVSLLKGNLRFDLKPNVHLEVSAANALKFDQDPIKVQAIALGPHCYRMDAVLTPERPLSWPVDDVLLLSRLHAHRIGVLGWVETQTGRVLVPLQVVQQGEPRPKGPVNLMVRSTMGIDSLRWRSSVEGQQGKEPPKWHRAATSPVPLGGTVIIALPDGPAAVLRIEVVARELNSNRRSRLIIRVVRPVPDIIISDKRTGPMWTREDNGGNINWLGANGYCRGLTLGDYTDWRLPTIEELEKLYDPEAEGRYKIRAPFELTGRRVWSTTKGRSDEAWLFDFFRGRRIRVRFWGRLAGDRRALCVRRSGA